MTEYAIFLEGVENLEELESAGKRIEAAAFRAINAGADRGRKLSTDEMRRQINFPAGYFRGQNSRLRVTKRAKPGDLEAVITGRDRPTSLARFRSSGQFRKQGVTVSVKPGRPEFLKRAFLMPLKGSMGLANNVGLAIRLPKGARPRVAYRPVEMARGLWLLYGPSVDQVFRGVRDDVAPDVSEYLQTEFSRLVDLNL